MRSLGSRANICLIPNLPDGAVLAERPEPSSRDARMADDSIGQDHPRIYGAIRQVWYYDVTPERP